jgi:hypothetical protein
VPWNLDDGKKTDVLIMNFSKAFGKVSHSLLITQAKTLWHNRKGKQLDRKFPVRSNSGSHCWG